VRVGVAAARALSLATGKPVVGVTSLSAMAHEARQQLGDAARGRLLIAAVDARGGMVYVQLFEDSGAAGVPALLRPAEAAAMVGRRQAVIVGSGAVTVANSVADASGQVEVALVDLQPRARAVAALAVDLAPTGPVRPLYLRLPDARLPAATDNAAELAGLHQGLFDKPWDAAAFQGMLGHPGATAFMARLSSPIEVVGFIVGQLAADDAEILTLGVRTDRQRHGIGRKLVEALARAAKKAEARRVFLEVGMANAAALGLYKSLGFQEVGRRKGYYQRPVGPAEDALTLALNL
jgi:ribosomal-protein-alanine N-acetyltransferase